MNVVVPSKKKATFNLDADLHQHLKVTAALVRREMGDLVEEALQHYFGWNRMTELEINELKTYELEAFHGSGQVITIDFISFSKHLGDAGHGPIAAQLLQYLEAQGRLVVEVWDHNQYRALASLPDTDCLYRGGNLHLRLTIPGRIRYQQLQQRRAWETKTSAE